MNGIPRTPVQQAAVLGRRQHGLITAAQAVSVGLSHDQCEDAVRIAGWSRLARGLYALPGSVASWQRDAVAACLLAGTDAVASDLTAAALWGWCSAPLLPEVVVPLSQSHRSPLARVHRRNVPLVDRAVRHGIRCTSASRTLVDVAGRVERSRLESFVDDALCSSVASPESVVAALERGGRRGRAGIGALTGVLDVWTEDIEPGSPAEMRLLRRLLGLGATDVVTQHEVCDEGGRFVARLDVALPERRHGFEYDSDRWHNPRRWLRDEPRYARLAALGWRIDPVCKLDLLASSTRIADLVAATSVGTSPFIGQKSG
jgi:hypothetical protein